MTPHRKIILLLPFFLISCWGQEKDSEKQETEYKTLRAKDTPEVRERLAAFKAQEHRLEFTGCELRYNGMAFFIGDTLEEFEAVLGKHDYNRGVGYFWKNINMLAFMDKNSKFYALDISIYRGYEEVLIPDDNYILINGIPLNRQMVFKDFLDSSNHTFEDVDFFTSYYSFIVEQCHKNDEELMVYFRSSVPYDTRGGGHILLRGEFDPESTKPVDEISFQYATIEDE